MATGIPVLLKIFMTHVKNEYTVSWFSDMNRMGPFNEETVSQGIYKSSHYHIFRFSPSYGTSHITYF